jgi:DNA-binding transcriptional LysR family regulator
MRSLNSWELIARTIEHHQGYGLFPDFITLMGRHPQLIPISKPSLPYTLNAIFHKGEQLSYSARTFLDSLKEFCLMSGALLHK